MYHISDNHNLTKLFPRIPKNHLTETGIEDNKTPRISLSKSIGGALKGLSRNVCDEILFVYEIVNKEDVKFLDSFEIIDKVPDAYLTEELWVLDFIELNLIKAIEIEDGKFLGVYECPNGLEVENWEWYWSEIDQVRLKDYGWENIDL
jgi:hypothetical protein